MSNKTVKVSFTLNQINRVCFAVNERIQEIIYESNEKPPHSKHYLYLEYQCLKRVYSNLKKLGEWHGY